MQDLLGIIFQFSVATVLPAVAVWSLCKLEEHTSLDSMNDRLHQSLYGIVFGLIAILGTEFGIQTADAVMNVRDAAPVAAGLLFGGPAGIIAGLI